MLSLRPMNGREHVDRTSAACLIGGLFGNGESGLGPFSRQWILSILPIRARDALEQLADFARRGHETRFECGLVYSPCVGALTATFERLSLLENVVDRRRRGGRGRWNCPQACLRGSDLHDPSILSAGKDNAVYTAECTIQTTKRRPSLPTSAPFLSRHALYTPAPCGPSHP